MTCCRTLLENTIEYALGRGGGPYLTLADLPPEVRAGRGQGAEGATIAPGVDGEAARLLRALEDVGWNRALAARALGMSRTTLWRRLQHYRLTVSRSRGKSRTA